MAELFDSAGGSMGAPTALAELLERYMLASGFTPERLVRVAGVPKPTLHRWLRGTAGKTQHWTNLLRVAAALGLNRARTDRLLRTAGQPSLATLLASVGADPDRALLARWAVESPNNLPGTLTSLIGRDDAILDLAELLSGDEVRLLTLTGPGGSGKTRLGIAVARTLLDTFPDGVWFVPLTPINDPALVLPRIAQVFGVREVVGEALAERLVARLRDRRVLLVLDNFEQVVDAGAQITALLRAADGVKALVTSRIPLHLDGEHERPVSPLLRPQRDAPLAALRGNPAIALFVARATAVNASFALVRGNTQAVAEICNRLDGLPLAIELAAARIRQFTPYALLARFPSRLDLGSDGPRDVEDRHKTLRATIDWSERLLTATERRRFARLAVFAGGWTSQAAEAVCRQSADELLGVRGRLAALIDANLVTPLDVAGSSGRFGMLETIREYALERLEASGEADAIRERHAAWCLAAVRQGERYFPGDVRTDWLDLVEREHDNVRVAIAWALKAGRRDLAALLAIAIWPFWHERTHFTEGDRWLTAVLSEEERLPGELRAQLLIAATVIAFTVGDLQRLRDHADAALRLLGELDEPYWQALVYDYLGHARMHQQDPQGADEAYERARLLWEQVGEQRGVARALADAAYCHGFYRQFNEARRKAQEAIALFRELGSIDGEGRMLNDLGIFATMQGHYPEAQTYLGQAVDLNRRALPTNLAFSLCYLGLALVLDNKPEEALPYIAEGVHVCNRAGNSFALLYCLLGMAGVASRRKQYQRAATLVGAAMAFQQRLRATMAAGPGEIYEREVELIYKGLGEDAFTAALLAGERMDLPKVVDYALDTDAD